jgi:hypothetical protein
LAPRLDVPAPKATLRGGYDPLNSCSAGFGFMGDRWLAPLATIWLNYRDLTEGRRNPMRSEVHESRAQKSRSRSALLGAQFPEQTGAISNVQFLRFLEDFKRIAGSCGVMSIPFKLCDDLLLFSDVPRTLQDVALRDGK